MGTINLNTIVKSALNRFDEEDLIDAWNMYLESIGDGFRKIYTAEYGIGEALQTYSLYEMALKIKEDCFDPYKKYFCLNDNDDMVSFRHISDEESTFDIDELAWWFISNKGTIEELKNGTCGFFISLSTKFGCGSLIKAFTDNAVIDEHNRTFGIRSGFCNLFG